MRPVRFNNTSREAGFPIQQLVLGLFHIFHVFDLCSHPEAVPAYGHSYVVSKANAFGNSSNSTTPELQLYPEFDPDQYPIGDAWDDSPGVDACGAEATQGGNWNFWGLVSAGFLNPDGSPSNKSEISYLFDECSQTVMSTPCASCLSQSTERIAAVRIQRDE